MTRLERFFAKTRYKALDMSTWYMPEEPTPEYLTEIQALRAACIAAGYKFDCWIWIGATVISKQSGLQYSRFWNGDKRSLAHNWAFENIRREKLDQDLQRDHLCRRPLCVNPWHLEQTTAQGNNIRGNGWSGRNARKRECINGHQLDIENTYITPKAWRACRICAETSQIRLRQTEHYKEYHRRYYLEHKEELLKYSHEYNLAHQEELRRQKREKYWQGKY